jgi:glycosyltransferase involved in cell wall biosynthesis
LAEERLANKELALPAVGRWCQRWIWNGADYALPVTGVLADYVRRYGVPEERIVVIPNGINPERFGRAPAAQDAKARLNLGGRLVLGFTGFVRAWHALDRVVDFVAEHGERYDLHFLVMGDGPARADIEAQAARRGVTDRVTVTGVVARDDVPSYVAAFDIALQPGITAYASPLKMFEYMYQGTAIVAPDMANIREVLTHGQDGLLFDPQQPGAMNVAILRLCQNPEERARLGAAARQTIETKGFKWDRNATRVIELARKARAAALGGA